MASITTRAARPATWGILFAGIIGILLVGSVTPSAACIGDCNGSSSVTIEELMQGTNIALGDFQVSQCSVFDQSLDDQVTVDEIVAAVVAALEGCPEPIITTIAGTGLAGLNQDGMPPLESHLYLPQDITIGPDGDLYLVDWNNHRVRRIRNDLVETIAGTGELGDAQDGVGIYTQFNHPTNVEFDHDGHLIIAAWHNSLVKRLYLHGEKVGLVENVAGTGARAFGGDDGPANLARLDLPSSVVVDSHSNIIISDQANFRLRLVEPNGMIHTICGDGTPGYAGDDGPAAAARLSSPRGQSAAPAGRLCIDANDNIYVADTGNHRIRKIDSNRQITTIAGTGEAGSDGDGGPAKEAQLNTPSDIALGPNGILYVADTLNNVVRAIAPDGTISRFAGTGERGFDGDAGPADDAQLDRPYGVTVAKNGDVYIADTHNQRIRKVLGVHVDLPPTPTPSPIPTPVPCTDVQGSICTYAGNGGTGYDGDGHNRLTATLYWPLDIEFTPSGRRVFLDWNNHLVREILEDETIVTIAGSDFVGDGPRDLSDLTPEGAPPLTVDLNHPTDIQEFPNGDIMFMAWHNHKIRVINDAGRVRVIMGLTPGGFPMPGDNVIAKDARVNQPSRAVLDPNGNLFFIDQRNQRIRVLLNFATDRENAMVKTVVNNTGPMNRGFNGDGVAHDTWVSFPTGGNPEPGGGVALDAQGRLYFSDTVNHRIRRVEFSGAADFQFGIVTTLAGDGTAGFSGDDGPATAARINFPEDLEIGPDGNVYFADANNNRIRRINLTTGMIETVAGTGEEGFSGDGGPATSALLNRPFGVAFDPAGDLYVSDSFNSRIRKVKLTPTTP